VEQRDPRAGSTPNGITFSGAIRTTAGADERAAPGQDEPRGARPRDRGGAAARTQGDPRQPLAEARSLHGRGTLVPARLPESRWIADWKTLASRYRNEATVVALDLHNEPHDPATWGGDPATDYASAAERAAAAIRTVNPNAIVIVGGVQTHQGITYWWGGNLRGVANRPLAIEPSKRLYSAHDYGPRCSRRPGSPIPHSEQPAGLWDQTWGYIPKRGLGGVFIGEFGIGHRDASGGKALLWIQTLMAYMGRTSSWTYWSLNPNSGDTGGILQDDWVSVQQWKLDVLTPYLAAQFPEQP
jgi:aryl-phospho-beta-D-glucosidase BglC (GH1 family)